MTSKDAVLYVYKETIFRLKKDAKRSLSLNENIDSVHNEKYNMRENINKVLYSAVDYVQNQIKKPEISITDINMITKITKANMNKKTNGYLSA